MTDQATPAKVRLTDGLYAGRDHVAQGDYYTRHVSAMTGEKLHAKSAIAAELAHRDIEIDRLRAALELRRHWQPQPKMPTWPERA